MLDVAITNITANVAPPGLNKWSPCFALTLIGTTGRFFGCVLIVIAILIENGHDYSSINQIC
jgi:hypothetical protein